MGGDRLEVQVPPDHYASEEYRDADREASYRTQERLLSDRGPVLEIGIGPGVVAERLRDRGVEVVTADLDPRLDPDVAASVTSLPFADDAVRTVAAFEVLEHLPVEVLPAAVAELARVASERVVVSVPEKADKLRTWISLNLLGREWDDPEHRWELGLFVSKRELLSLFDRVGLGLSAFDGSHDWHRFFVFTPDGVGPWRGRLATLRRTWSKP